MATTEELANHLHVPEGTLKQWRWLGTGPKFYTVGRHVRYDWADVDAWLADNASGGAAA